jgi:predicted acylesterase/phospholipase RssA
LQSDSAKFDHNILEQQIKDVIESSRLNLESDSPLEDPCDDACKTFVVAQTLRDGGSAVRMRSYTSRRSYAFPSLIWEAARATSAAPTFFEPITIDGEIYSDGGIGWNNPSEEAIAEARQVWPNRQIGCLVSLGTGLESAMQFGDKEKTVERWLLDKVLPTQSRLIDVAKYCVNCLTSSEKVHRRLCEDGEMYGIEGVYFRFNVPQGMSKVGLEEWDKTGDMTTLTKNYMRADARSSRDAVARILLERWLPSLSL